MAIVQRDNGEILTDFGAICEALQPLNISLAQWPVGEAIAPLLAAETLDADQKEQVLLGLDTYFNRLKTDLGYSSRDLIVLHPAVPNLAELLDKFAKIHSHADDEVRYIVDGQGVFGFVLPDGRQLHLTVEAEEYINIPAETEHWFYLTPANRVKAVRYFCTMEGWVPEYTGRSITPIAPITPIAAHV
jgi:1,2-dihydroxy-3-keto-5-methylthiopentene dioxygenase